MTFLTAKSLPRRTVLRGPGRDAGAAAPRGDDPGRSRARRRHAVHRFQTFYVPNGMAMEYWLPKTEGAAFELTPILEPLAPFRDQMLVLSGLKANWNYIHAGASGSFLTGTTRGGRNEVEIIADVSMDQLLARHFASETQVASLELAMDRAEQRRRLHRQSELRLHAHAVVAQPDAAAADGVQPARGLREAVRRQRQHRPRGAGSAAAAAQEHPRLGQRQAGQRSSESLGPAGPGQGRTSTPSRSATSSAAFRRPRSSATSSCRRWTAAGRAAGVRGSPGADARPAAAGVPVGPDARHLVHDQQGTERAAVSADRRARGAPSAVASRRRARARSRACRRSTAITRELFAKYLAKLRATPDGDGSLLDHMTILYGSGISNSNRHSGDNLPLLLDGRRRRDGSRAAGTSPTPTSRRWPTCWSR